MGLKGDAVELCVLVALVAAAVWYAKKKSAELAAAVPQVVKDGGEAAWVLAGAAVDGVTHPLDSFGISPGVFSDGTPKYQTTVPWQNPDDKVSNSDTGINFNLF